MRAWLMIVVLAGCEKKQERFEGPMPIAFGDCASATVAFVSGPRPQAFDAAAAEKATVAAFDPPPADDVQRPMPKPDRQNGAFASLTGTSGFDDKNIYGGLLGNDAGAIDSGFGFGRNGFGPGGGTGWGTIGTGRYGTIGHGSGYGVGGGRGYGRMAAVPTVSVGQPNAQGDLDKAIIRRYIKRNITKIQYCYEKQLLAKPKIAGTIATQFFITPAGTVASASASGFDDEVASCVAAVIKDIEFPKPKGGGGVQVNYPFTFRSGDNTPSPAPPAAEPPTTPPPAVADTAKRLYRGGAVATYEPGAENPLRLERDALTECLRRNPAHSGAAVVELHYDPKGGVASAFAHDIHDESTQECIAELAKRVVQPKGAPAVQRCALAFGEQPASTIVALTPTAVTLGGKPIALAPDDALDIPALTTEVASGVKSTLTSKVVVAAHPPLVLRPDPATPMKLVARAWRSILGAGDDFVFAALTQPTPPVPFSTGVRRARVKTYGNTIDGDERVDLSIFVTKDKVWVGVSRVNELVETNLDGLEAKLKDEKASAFFADRTDLEIAGDDDVPFSDVARVMELAPKVGFSDWRLTDPQHLAAKPQM